MSKPIRPEEVGNNDDIGVPDDIIDAVNYLIKSRMVNGVSEFHADAISELCPKLLISVTEVELWNRVEQIYSESNWAVNYNQEDNIFRFFK